MSTHLDRRHLNELRDLYGGRDLAALGFFPRIAAHPATNAALALRLTEATNTNQVARPRAPTATLYINDTLCDGPDGCRQVLGSGRLLPERWTLTVYGANGFLGVYKGRPDPPDTRSTHER